MTAARRTLDFRKPIAVLLLAILHFIPDADDPYAIVKKLMDAVPAGSFLVVCNSSSDIHRDQVAEMTRLYNQSSAVQVRPRSRDEVLGFFSGLDLIGPGVVPLSQWLEPGGAGAAGTAALAGYVGVGKRRA